MSESDGWPWLGRFEPHPRSAAARPVVAGRAMVATAHPQASRIGLDVLRGGGNAVDAGVAASAALVVALPMQCSLGGDAFWLMHMADGDVSALDASGRSGVGADPAAMRRAGTTRIDPRSAESVTVPGLVSGWVAALARHGTCRLATLLEPAAALAEDGVFVTRHMAASFRAAMPVLRRWGALGLWAHGGDAPPALYQRLRQPALAAALRAIGASDGHAIYDGPIAEAIVSAVRSRGGWLTPDDLRRHSAAWVAPVRVRFRGLDIVTTPPASQGIALAQACGIVEALADGSFHPNRPGDAHLMIEAVALALRERDRVLADADLMRETQLGLLEPSTIQRLAAEIALQRMGEHTAWTGAITRGDTAHLAVVDSERRAVSLTQSLFFDFGSGIPVPDWGFTLQNRGAAFALDPGAPNRLLPGIRPPHTLTPSLAFDSGRLALVLGCMGGDGQVQTQLQLLAGLRVEGLDAQQAIAKPRWYLDRPNRRVLIEARADGGLIEGLRERGHAVVVIGDFEDVMGHAQVIELRPEGALVGGCDPRSDGQVAAW